SSRFTSVSALPPAASTSTGSTSRYSTRPVSGEQSVASSMRVWIVATFLRTTSTCCSDVASIASASPRVALVVSTLVLRTSSSRCEPAPCSTRRCERAASTPARSISLFCLVMLAFDTARRSSAAWTAALASASCDSSVTGSIFTSTWPGFTSAPSSTRISFTRSGSRADTSTSFPSMRPLPDAIPSGSAFLFLIAYLMPMNATIATAAPARIHFQARLDGFLTMADSLLLSRWRFVRGLGLARLRQHVAPVRPLLHLALCLLGHHRLAFAQLPAAAQRLVERDQARRDRRGLLRQGVLLLQQRTLRVQHPLVVGGAFPVLHQGQLHRALRGGDGVLLEHLRLLGAHEAGQRVLDLLRGTQHGVAVGDQRLREARVLDAHRVRQPAVVQERPVDGGTGGIEDAAGREQVVRPRPLVEGAQADRPEQREAGVEVGLGDADARGLRGGQQLGPANVGTAAQHLGRHAHRHLRGRPGDVLRPGQQRLDGSRRVPQQRGARA